MNFSKFIFFSFLTLASTLAFGQKSIFQYRINLFSDTTIHDTIIINLSYSSDLRESKGFVKLKRVDTNYLIQVFWEKMIDSSGFLVEGKSLDTSYYVGSRTLINNLKNDFKKANPKKILELTKWTYTFIVTDKINETLEDKEGLYYYHLLRYNEFLKV